MRESFVFYKSFYESIKELDPQEQVKVYNAIFEYEFNENKIELNGITKSIFTLILPQLEANNKRYENGKKGGRPKTKLKPKQNQTKTKTKPNDNVNDNVNVNDNDNVYFKNTQVNDLFLEFLKLRIKLKCKNTDRAINLLVNELNKYPDEIKIQMINNSIMNSWKSVYPLKNDFKKDKKLPDWFNQDIQKQNITKKDQEEMENLLKNFK